MSTDGEEVQWLILSGRQSFKYISRKSEIFIPSHIVPSL